MKTFNEFSNYLKETDGGAPTTTVGSGHIAGAAPGESPPGKRKKDQGTLAAAVKPVAAPTPSVEA